MICFCKMQKYMFYGYGRQSFQEKNTFSYNKQNMIPFNCIKR